MDKKFSISEVIDSLGVSKFTISKWILVGLTLTFVGFAYMIVPYTMPQMTQEWALSKVQTGSLHSWSLLGLTFGAMAAGNVSDRFGRKKTLAFFCALFSLVTLPVYFVNSFEAFAFLRVLAGIGFGACLPIGVTMMSESAPTKNRGFFSASMMAFYVLGWVLAGIVAIYIVPTYGWRLCYLIASLPIFYVVILLTNLTESTHWLLSKGREEEAIHLIKQMEIAAKGKAGEWAPGSLVAPPPPHKVGLSAIFSPEYRKTTATLWAMYFMGTWVVAGIAGWLPTLLVGKGFGLVKGYSFAVLQSVIGVVGALSTGYMADIIGRKKNVTLAWGLTAIAIVLLGYASDQWILVSIILVGLFMNWGLAGVQPLLVEGYRTEFRTTGVSWAQACGRVGGFIGPIAAGFAQQMGADFTSTFLTFTIPAIFAVLIGIFCVAETRGKSIESLATAKH